MRALNPSSTKRLEVELADGLPVRLRWGGRCLRVQSAKCIELVQGRWWLDWEHRGETRRTYRVDLSDGRGHVFCAHLVHQSQGWQLARVLD